MRSSMAGSAMIQLLREIRITIPSEFVQFLPMGPTAVVPPQARRPPGRNPSSPKPPADPESTPQRQRARHLGSYGADVLRDSIKAEYSDQFSKWKKHIGLITTAFSMALGQQVSTMKKAEAEKRAKAEFALFIFSLITAGVMRWAGTFLQYKIYPKAFQIAKMRNVPIGSVPEGFRFKPVVEFEYNKQMAAFAGGITTDVGSQTLRFISQRQRQDAIGGAAPDDTGSLVRLTEESLTNALEDGTKVVADDMQKAIFWMEQSPDFGEAWANFVGGNEFQARNLIRLRLQDLRDDWAKRWPYFGQDPKPIDQVQLSQAFERLLWAAFVDTHFTQEFIALGKWQGVGPYSPEDVFSKKMDKNQNYFSRSLEIGESITDRLKRLNIVEAETYAGWQQQLTWKASEGAPVPSVQVSTEVDSFDEVRAIWKWARDYPGEVQAAVRHAGSEGVPRTLKAIPAYN